jgi:alanine dehydrogenase
MGFYFAKPTTFKNPMLTIGGVDYYAVDHTPSYLWESASRSISAALIVHLPTVVEGRESWKQNETIQNAIIIDGGVIKKSSIISFQNRQPFYPHASINT